MLEHQTTLDLTDEFAVPLVASAIFDMTGLQPTDENAFAFLAREMFERMTGQSLGSHRRLASACEKAIEASTLEEYIFDRVQQGKWEHDGITAAFMTSPDWRPLHSDRMSEAANIAIAITGAGLLNTVSTLVNAVVHLAKDNCSRRSFIGQPKLRSLVVDELLRLFPPTAPGRVVMRDTVLEGKRLRVGESVLAALRAANRDPVFGERVDQISLERRPCPHLSFGAGAHMCVGAPLARMLLMNALLALLTVMPRYEIISTVTLPRTSPQRWPPKRILIGSTGTRNYR